MISFLGLDSLLYGTTLVAIFSETVNVINVNLCMIVPLIKLYQFIRLSVTLDFFEGHSSVKQLKSKRSRIFSSD